jgi:uncharacterized membrane protein YphA (DoxX/SURF4 family)
MNLLLWILQGLLALAFLAAGTVKLTQPKEKLEPRMSWTRSVSPGPVKAIGAVELLGALGVILPWATGIAKILTPLAALGLAITMVAALITHIRLKEYGKELVAPAILLVLAVLVAIGRG